MLTNYSVLMSVYFKEQPSFLRESIDSIARQTCPTDDFVLVCDGPLTKELDEVIESAAALFEDGVLHVVRLPENVGLGNALNKALPLCKNELVARMDSDDISMPDRCEKQLQAFEGDPALQILSGTIEEFTEDPDDVTGVRCLPLTHGEIRKFSKHRNPFNHPAVMFKKQAVIDAGGYREEYHLFEDYDLWLRMLMAGCKGGNLQDTLLKMRTSPSQIKRRGGWQYARTLLRFHKWIKKQGWSSAKDYLLYAWPHAVICVMPNFLRQLIYKLLR